MTHSRDQGRYHIPIWHTGCEWITTCWSTSSYPGKANERIFLSSKYGTRKPTDALPYSKNVVHEGQTSGGHYWVYIFDHITKTWVQFNDIHVNILYQFVLQTTWFSQYFHFSNSGSISYSEVFTFTLVGSMGTDDHPHLLHVQGFEIVLQTRSLRQRPLILGRDHLEIW